MMIPNWLRIRNLVAIAFLVGSTALLKGEDYAITNFAGGGSLAGGGDGTPGAFNNPYSIAIDTAKNLYIADTLSNTIRKITPAGVVSTLAGTAGVFGTTDGTGSAARFNFPVGITVDSAGNVYVADAKNFTIRKITAAGVTTTHAGAAFQLGATDGPAASARFFLPYGVAVDASGNVYVADGGNHVIRRISAAGVVSTVAGTAQQPGFVNGTGAAARFNTPWGLAVDGSGNVYVADSENNAIRRVTPGGVVTTVAGSGISGSADGAAAAAQFNRPRGVSVGAADTIYVADYGNSIIRMITAGGTVSTVAGAANIVGLVNSVGASARFYDPTDVVADGTTVYVADTSNNLIRKGVPASTAALPVISVQPLDQVVSVGQAVSFRVAAAGSGLTYQWLRNGVVIPGATSATYTIASPQASDVAVYLARITGSGGAVDSTPGTLSVTPLGSGPIIITARPLSQQVEAGQAATFSISATGTGLTYQWLKNGAEIAGATSSTYGIASAQTADAGTYSVRVTSGSSTDTATAKLIVGTSSGIGITITNQPSGQSVAAGQPLTLSVTASSLSPLGYQWFKNDVAIAGATGATFTIAAAQAGDSGTYRVRVSSSGGTLDSDSVSVTVGVSGPTARLSNLSVRTTMEAGQTLIVGTFVSGGARNILVRAAGPALAGFGLSGAMADPRLQLYNGATLALSNDNWAASLASTFDSVGAFGFAANSLDAAFVQSIEGGRSIWAQGTGPGVVLVEAYDLGTGNSPRMVNVSARNRVGTGDDILIAGFNIAGTGSKQLLIRAVGPKLAVFGVTGVLEDPILEVYSGSTKLTENDNWSAGLASTFDSVGAFQLDAGSKDAALLTSLPPGSYTVQVRGAAGGTGEALIEIYEIP